MLSFVWVSCPLNVQQTGYLCFTKDYEPPYPLNRYPYHLGWGPFTFWLGSWMAEPFSKWGGAQVHVKKLQNIFVVSVGNY